MQFISQHSTSTAKQNTDIQHSYIKTTNDHSQFVVLSTVWYRLYHLKRNSKTIKYCGTKNEITTKFNSPNITREACQDHPSC
jgi:rRNA-processing protein FCF1